MVMKKKASLLNQVVVHIILVGLIFAVFLMATAGKVEGRGVKQQVLEKQTALLIDSAEPGMDFIIYKINSNGVIRDVKIDHGRVWIGIDGFDSYVGYPYFSKYSVSVRAEEGKFVVSVR